MVYYMFFVDIKFSKEICSFFGKFWFICKVLNDKKKKDKMWVDFGLRFGDLKI